MNKRLAVTLFLVVLMVSVSACAGAIDYQKRWLDLPPGYSYADAKVINDNGQVAGSVWMNKPVFWDVDGVPMVIPFPNGVSQMLIAGMNNKGQIALSASGSHYTAHVWTKGKGFIALSFPPGGEWAYVKGINDLGQVIGWYGGLSLPSGLSCVWDADTGAVLSISADASFEDINDLGQICGTSYGDDSFPAIWNPNGLLTPLSPLPGMPYGRGQRINRIGQVAGYSVGSEGYILTLWDVDGSAIQIGSASPWCEVEDLNDAGQAIVNRDDGGFGCYLWNAEDGLTAWQHHNANSINNLGQIAGNNGQPHPYVCTPDNLNPLCADARPSVTELWPPDGRMVRVSILGVIDRDGDEVTLTIDSITQDEPLVGKGTANTAPDATGIGTDTAMLRAERMGNGNGRVYRVLFTAQDSRGAKSKGLVKVYVPHDQREGATCVDDGLFYDSTEE